MRVDEAEIDRAVQSIATQNKLTMPQLRERLRSEGLDYARFRANLRDQILLERVREREVGQRTRVTDAEVDKFIAERTTGSAPDTELNIAQILVIVPEGASAETVAQRQARAEAALARVRGGEDFATVAREVSEDANRARGGEWACARCRACRTPSSRRCATCSRARWRRACCVRAPASMC